MNCGGSWQLESEHSLEARIGCDNRSRVSLPSWSKGVGFFLVIQGRFAWVFVLLSCCLIVRSGSCHLAMQAGRGSMKYLDMVDLELGAKTQGLVHVIVCVLSIFRSCLLVSTSVEVLNVEP